MRLVVQRVADASVSVDGEVVSSIGHGLLVLVGVAEGDTAREAGWLAEKTANLRIFADEHGKMNRSVLDVSGQVLAVSQFTLLGDARKGRRPSYTSAAPPEVARELYQAYCQNLQDLGIRVGQGVFQAHMHVRLTNDGPVTIIIDTNEV